MLFFKCPKNAERADQKIGSFLCYLHPDAGTVFIRWVYRINDCCSLADRNDFACVAGHLRNCFIGGNPQQRIGRD